MTLFTISVLLILIIGFLATMSTERRAGLAFEDTERAKLVAQGALSHAIDLLRTNIPEPARLEEGPRTAPGENWITNPGRLTVIKEGAAPVHIPLHTGEVSEPPDPSLPRDAESFDLNQPLPGETTPLITGLAESSTATKRPPMRVKWVNVARDPSKHIDSKNPMVSRYAFWMDDETSWLNFHTALGKPAPGKDASCDKQLEEGFVTPCYKRGSYESGWALGRPQSVNLDVLLTDPSVLQRDRLLDNIYLRGFSRYPEAVLDYLTLQSNEARDWYEREKFHLAFASRSPEFNAFNRSRLFTTFVPMSLEGGPNFQHSFLYFAPSAPTADPKDKFGGAILHLNALLGNFGFTSQFPENDGTTVNGGNVVNRAQVEMLVEYFNRKWPGYSRSFRDKYGPAGIRQLALNILLMARMATAPVANTSVDAFSQPYSFRSTSVNFSPASNEMPAQTPERMYWRFPGEGKNGLFLPQTPGPHVTEVRLFAKVADSFPLPKGYTPGNGAKPRVIQYWYEVEYYMHPLGPIVNLKEMPVRMDYFEIRVNGKQTGVQRFGPQAPTESRYDADWDYGADPSAPLDLENFDATKLDKVNLRRMVIYPNPSIDRSVQPRIGPKGAKIGGVEVPNRVTLRSQIFTVGKQETVVPWQEVGRPELWNPQVFDATIESDVTVDIRFRAGVGVLAAPQRPRQMIPLGETRDDTLKATFRLNLNQPNRDFAVSWQIADPLLSHDVEQWEKVVTGPGNPLSTGTPGIRNSNEPDEDSPEKSKFRYLQRGATGATIGDEPYDRPDEYEARSRVTSPGYWSLLHTGMQSGDAWKRLDFGDEGKQASPPDWLILDLLGPTYPLAAKQFKESDNRKPDDYSTVSFMNSTAGQINLNSRIFPQNDFFKPPARTKPLQALFEYLPGLNAEKIARNIDAYQSNDKFFDYVGEVANVPGIAGSGAKPWDKEFALRNMAGVLTTRSNTFGVWGVAQVVKKNRKNTQADRFERGDQVVASKRFHAIVERYIWAGRDGIPGNAHLTGGGVWDRLATPKVSGHGDILSNLPGSPPLRGGARLSLNADGKYPLFDGPQEVKSNEYFRAALGEIKWSETRLEEAYTPPQALVKYRVVSFRYLDR